MINVNNSYHEDYESSLSFSDDTNDEDFMLDDVSVQSSLEHSKKRKANNNTTKKIAIAKTTSKKPGRPKGSKNRKVLKTSTALMKEASLPTTEDEKLKSTPTTGPRNLASMPVSTCRFGLSLPKYVKRPRYVHATNCFLLSQFPLIYNILLTSPFVVSLISYTTYT